MAKLTKDQVKFLSFEGGGAAGFTVHPGVNQALEELGILTYDEDGRQNGIKAFAGSSSGSVLATLTSLGYHHDEISQLLSPAAFDMIFRLEKITLGERLVLGEQLKETAITDDQKNLGNISLGNLWANPVGTILDSFMALQSNLKILVDPLLIYSALYGDLAKRLSSVMGLTKSYLKEIWKLKNLIITQLKSKEEKINLASDVAIVEFYKNNYPYLVVKIIQNLLSDQNNIITGSSRESNIFNIIKQDYGIFSGLQWRKYFDNAITFAAFRISNPEIIDFLELPSVQEYENTYDIKELFLNKINIAWNEVHANESADSIYEKYLNITFEKHKVIFYPNSKESPLHLTGANLSSKESHVFSYSKTKNMCVADAIRISTSVAPIFKPIILNEVDIPNNFPNASDRFGNKNFMVGFWFDGGLYLDSPVDVLKEYETANEKLLGIGIGINERIEIINVTEYAKAIFDITNAIKTNISYTAFDLDRFINYVGFDIEPTKPKMSNDELKFYKMYSYYETINYFDPNSAGESYIG